MHLWQAIRKPEYLHRPSQLLRRLLRRTSAPARRVRVGLPWGSEIEVHTGDAIGQAIWQMGVYDLTVTEALWRLADPGETALDVGGNIGYMTCVLAARIGPRGQVHTFEPHPEVHAELAANAARWTPASGHAVLHLHAVGLSDHAGTATLSEPPQFGGNRGTSTLETGSAGSSGRGFSIAIRRLDDHADADLRAGVAKVDVEGHELGVFRGAERLLREHRIRDLVYEDNDGYPGRVSALLEGAGYTIRRLSRTLAGPRLSAPADRLGEDWLPSSFLATADPARAEARLAPAGWQALRGRRTG